MQLFNVKVWGQQGSKDIFIQEGAIRSVCPHEAKDNQKEVSLVFNNAIAFPGLINSHDHLDFNLFPPIKNKTLRQSAGSLMVGSSVGFNSVLDLSLR